MAAHLITCTVCGAEFSAARAHAKFCSDACRQRARRKAPPPPGTPAAQRADAKAIAADLLSGASLIEQVRAELDAARKLETPTGQAALVVAGRMLSPFSKAGEVASLSRELSRLMLAAVGPAAKDESVVDEVKAKREQKIARARAAQD